jgi:hypothetical protein
MSNSSGPASASASAKNVVLHDAQRTVRPFGLKCAGSMTYSLAQDGQVISMANQIEIGLAACEGRVPIGEGFG